MVEVQLELNVQLCLQTSNLQIDSVRLTIAPELQFRNTLIIAVLFASPSKKETWSVRQLRPYIMNTFSLPNFLTELPSFGSSYREKDNPIMNNWTSYILKKKRKN